MRITSFDDVEFHGREQVAHNGGTGYRLDYVYDKRHFSVLISDAPPKDCDRGLHAIEQGWLNRMGNQGERLKIAKEIKDNAFPTLKNLISSEELAPIYPGTVEDYLFPRCVRLELVTRHLKPKVRVQNRGEPDRTRQVIPWTIMLEIGITPESVPCFAANATLLDESALAENIFDIWLPTEPPRKVIGKFIPLNDEGQLSMLKREMEIYAKLKRLSLDHETRVPELKGLITSGEGVVGFAISNIGDKHPSLKDLIPSSLNGNFEIRLRSDLPSLDLRRKWVEQVEHTVKQLHRHGIIWGNPYPDNVVIDAKDNAWVLDFGGGRKVGWKKRSTVWTVEGDLRGIKEMKEGLQRLVGT